MKKILIIDDDATFQKTMTTKLGEKGFEALTAADGEEGLAKALADKPDLILLDIRHRLPEEASCQPGRAQDPDPHHLKPFYGGAD